MEILWKDTVTAYFLVNRPKLCGNCAFPQNFHTRKLGEITLFYAVVMLQKLQKTLKNDSESFLIKAAGDAKKHTLK